MTADFSPARARFSLAQKLWLLFTLIFLITYLSISLIVLYNVDVYLQDHVKKELSTLAGEKLAVVKREFSYQLTNVQAWSKLDVGVESVKRK